MIALLETRPDVAKGFSKGNVAPFWSTLATELNSMGPPIKDSTGWKKVWFDYKSNLKKKLAHNVKELRATGGGPNKLIELSDLEEQAVCLTGLRATVEGVQHAISFGTPSCEFREDDHTIDASGQSNETLDVISDLNNRIADSDDDVIRSLPKPKKSKRTAIDLLEEQINEQKKHHQTVVSTLTAINNRMDDFGYNVRRIYKTLSSIDESKKSELEEQRRHNAAVEKSLKDKLQLKQQIIEMQLAYINDT
ncbi:uncharacterized protein LOC131690658 [Topomyia yanbarensis]|uniref:uncharacterized protein LOC131687371 n=1 Tax=Topomyia yanbarensis TaxID=2498891 RepID=UPI00273CBF9A|nr:uncharacterized protein LOC131687371 [Topomyia yanbarensis]XP_058832572.1 uncharacterized protein LOC131690657 [Topomyia yanbarensis]XP_058832573.1 uncharacterized protein LOC131690658 [Topomyia yanbarensis]